MTASRPCQISGVQQMVHHLCEKFSELLGSDTSTKAIVSLPIKFKCKVRITNRCIWNRKRVMAGVSICRFATCLKGKDCNHLTFFLTYDLWSPVSCHPIGGGGVESERWNQMFQIWKIFTSCDGEDKRCKQLKFSRLTLTATACRSVSSLMSLNRQYFSI